VRVSTDAGTVAGQPHAPGSQRILIALLQVVDRAIRFIYQHCQMLRVRPDCLVVAHGLLRE
jgi:hypothetical protein